MKYINISILTITSILVLINNIYFLKKNTMLVYISLGSTCLMGIICAILIGKLEVDKYLENLKNKQSESKAFIRGYFLSDDDKNKEIERLRNLTIQKDAEINELRKELEYISKNFKDRYYIKIKCISIISQYYNESSIKNYFCSVSTSELLKKVLEKIEKEL